jgi:serine/threonine protein kinase
MSTHWLTCPACRLLIPSDPAKGGRPHRCPACAAPLPVEKEVAADSQWFYAQQKRKHGPVSWGQLRQLAGAGRVQPGDMILQAGGNKWLAASAIAGLFSGAEPAPRAETPAIRATAGTVPESQRVVTAPLPTVAGYEILGELGRGGMGVVYKARQQGLKRLVALKMILSGVHAGTQELARFRHEAEAVARLQHPNIVQIYEVGEQEGRPYFSLELIDGGSLDRKLAGRPVPPREAAQLVRTLAEAMHAAHQQGVIHRDLKPANILLTADGQPKITDFGLAKQLDDASAQTRSGAILGTPSYAAPEQAAGKLREVGPPTDVYALGALLYEMLIGRPPFKGETPLDTVLQVLSQEAVPPRQLDATIPRDLEIICLKCLEKQPGLRYGSAAALAEDLRRFLNGESILARPAGPVELLWRWCRRNPLPATFLIVVTVLLIVVSLGSALGLWHLSRLSEEMVRSTALESAAQQAEMLESLNTFYSAQVVDRVKGYNIEVTHDYAGKKGAIPLPASLTIDLGNHISEHSERGMQVRLYSDYPFRSRKNGLPKDAFEWEALGRLRSNPAEPVYKFEDMQGKPTLRYATARVMKQSCVACHNTHPESTKTNWKTGEVRGVVEIIRPLDRDVLRTREGLRGTFALIAAVSGVLLLVLTTAVLLLGFWTRRHLRPGASS